MRIAKTPIFTLTNIHRNTDSSLHHNIVYDLETGRLCIGRAFVDGNKSEITTITPEEVADYFDDIFDIQAEELPVFYNDFPEIDAAVLLILLRDLEREVVKAIEGELKMSDFANAKLDALLDYTNICIAEIIEGERYA